MLTKKIIYYITDHGRGHATRSVAIIRELENLGIEVIIRNSNAVDFLQKSLPKIQIIGGVTDVGPSINDNGISIDKTKTKINIIKWIDNFDYLSNQEVKIISKFKPSLIISDISAMPFLAAKKAKQSSLAISNFSWYDVLKFLPKERLDVLRDAYDATDLAICLPIGTDMKHFRKKRKSGLISRVSVTPRLQLRKKFGIKKTDIVILFVLGKSNIKINCKITENVKILSMNTILQNSNYIHLSNWTEGQEIITASDLVICKCGYGVISECLTNGIPFCYIADDNHVEQRSMSNELSKMGLMNRITFDDLMNFQLNERYKDIMSNPIRKPLDIDTVIKTILEFIKK